MFTKQCVVTLDLEGVLAPEIWIAVSEKTGIKDLRLTTRDIPDYDVLTKGRIKILVTVSPATAITRLTRALLSL